MINNPLANIRDEVSKLPDLASHKTNWRGALAAFRARISRTSRRVIEEPEILVFAVLQWLIIAAGYVAWFQILHFIPNEPAAAMPQPGVGTGFGTVIVMLMIGSLWSLAILALVALPVGILSAAMGAAHILRRTGQASTAGRCLAIAARQFVPLWTYHAIDGYFTVETVISRLPRRNDNRTSLEKLFHETLYFAWKLGCAGVLPAMICGHGLIESGRRSLGFVKAKLGELALLRAGYAGLCWGIGAATYLISLYVLLEYPRMITTWLPVVGGIDFMVMVTGLPVITALAVILIVLQPIYILSVCDLYVDHVEESGEPLSLANPERKSEQGATGAMTYLAIAILAAIVAHQFGIAEWVANFDRGAA